LGFSLEVWFIQDSSLFSLDRFHCGDLI